MSPRMLAVLALAAPGAAVFAQTPCPDNNPPVNNTNCVTNPSFEAVDPFNSAQPNGWHNISDPTNAKRRTPGDGLLPALVPANQTGLHTHSGDWCVQITTSGFGGFKGFTTDTLNFFQTGFPFFDPIYDYSFTGDVLVTGWYMIPSSSPISGDYSFIKINMKVGNQDAASFENYSASSTVQIPGAPAGTFYPPGITGHTNGQWQQFVFRIPRIAIVNQYECNRGIQVNCGCACVPANPPMNHIKITPSRFTGDGSLTSGTIFWDDISYAEVPAVASCHGACVADFDDGSGLGHPDGGVTIDDLLYYLGIFDAGAICADVDDGSGTGTQDGGVTIDDLLYYLLRFDAGC